MWEADCEASVRTGFAMTGLCKRCGVRADVGIGPYEFFAIQIFAIKKGCR